jgi:hypothetical protein
MINSSAGNRNPVPPIIHVIDEALGRLLYFPIGYQRGLLHSSEIDPGESAMGLGRVKTL